MARSGNFVDRHAFMHAFLGNRLERAVNVITAQGGALLKERKCAIAPAAASTLLFISEQPGCSMADIAGALRMPHQVIAQRLEALEELNFIVRKADPNDGRRKVLVLTAKGKQEARRLRGVLHDANRALQALNDELGFDASDGALRLIEALERLSMSERVAECAAEDAA
ncbi:MAG: MarR family winged helix-turn-helix transcriptional regulator [Pseudomonadota bacterium]